jgi:small subunit ribosomal protein S1
MAELAVGQTRDGTVTSLQNFGAFVDIGGVDGLIHISQLSWDHIRHPSEVVKEGQKVNVRIEKIDEATGKIGLSYRDLMHHPWEGVDGKYPIGDIVTGTVTKIMEFGAFVKLEPGVEGLVHISELSRKRVGQVSHVVEEGQRVEVKVLTIDAESQRISLSMKAAEGAPEADDAGSGDPTDEPIIKHVPRVPAKSLKGGVGRSSGGDQFGLKW